MRGQQAVLHGPEEGAERAEEDECCKQHRQRWQQKAGGGQQGDRNFDQPDARRDIGLVELVGVLTGQCGEEKKRQNERRARQRSDGRTVFLRQPVNDEHGESIFQQVVVKRRQ